MAESLKPDKKLKNVSKTIKILLPQSLSVFFCQTVFHLLQILKVLTGQVTNKRSRFCLKKKNYHLKFK